MKSIEELYQVFKDRCKLIKITYRDSKLIDEDTNIYQMFNMYSNFEDIMTYQEYLRVKNFDITRYHKRERCAFNYEKILILAKISKAKLVFGTITLNDSFFNETNDNQIKLIQRYIKKSFFYSIKNADYGKKNERLHYHFIGLTFEDLIDTGKKSHQGRPLYNIKNDVWKYGHLPVYEIIPYDLKEHKKITNYIVKLNNHSNKLSVKRTKLSILKNFEYLKKQKLPNIELIKTFAM